MPEAFNVTRISVMPIEDGSIVLELYDHDANPHAFAFNESGIRALLEIVIESASQICDHPNLIGKAKNEVLREVNAPIAEATQFALSAGRSPEEGIVKISLGEFSLSFFTPLSKIIDAFMGLREQIHNPKRH